MTNKTKIEALDFAIDAVWGMHGRVTDAEHAESASACKCEYGQCIRNLKDMKRQTQIHSRTVKMRVVSIVDGRKA